MHKARLFFFACAGIFLLAAAYHLGARSATAQAWRHQYLEAGINTLTMDKVTKKLGPPHQTGVPQDGSTVWRYQYKRRYVRSTTYRMYWASRCEEYILTFDENGVLRQWNRLSREC